MKKIILLFVIAIFGFANVNAQGFKLGANVGIPTGYASDFSSFSIGADVNFLWQVSDTFDAGLAAGFSHSFVKEKWDSFIDDVQFLPIAAAGRYNPSENFKIGADLGYGIGINDGNDGGFYYRPMVGYDISETIELNLSYSGVTSDGDTWSIIALGVMFAL